MNILLDGDAIVYLAGFASETRVKDTVGGVEYIRQDPIPSKEVEAIVRRIVSKIIRTCGDGDMDVDIKVFLTDPDIRNNSRYQICKSYKAARKGSIKPVYYNNIREYLIAKYDTIVVDGIEADDAMGIHQDNTSIIVSHDKDMLMIPGNHYSLTYKKMFKVSDPGKLKLYKDKAGKSRLLGTGFKWFCAQMFMGDEADTIKGLYRYGPVKTFGILNNIKTMKKMWEMVEEHYYDTDNGDMLEINAQLLWIRREENEDVFDFVGSL